MEGQTQCSISNVHNPEIVTTRNRRNQPKLKLNIVIDYTNGMGGVDHSDQMISYYESMKKKQILVQKICYLYFSNVYSQCYNNA